MFNAREFCNDFDIHVPKKNQNCADGYTNIRCIYCDDQSNHLSINEFDGSFICWKCGKHDTYETISLLTGTDISQAYKIIKLYKSESNYEEKQEIIRATTITVPGNALLKPHRMYLENRNFDPDYLVHKYELTGTLNTDDAYAYRIIAPVYYNKKIVTYQGRDYTNKQKRKYMACEKPNEILHHKDILFNLDNCNSDRVIVCEGVYGCFRVGDDSCATFGISFKTTQILELHKHFKKIFVLFDLEPQAQEKAKELCKRFALLGGTAINITLDSGDPADQKPDDIIALKKDLLGKVY